MGNIVYYLTDEDISMFLKNKRNLKAVSDLVQNKFSCMEELQYFVKNAENQVTEQQTVSQSSIKVNVNQMELINVLQLLITGKEFLNLENDSYIMSVYLASDEKSGKSLSYKISYKEYYSDVDYKLVPIFSDSLAEGLKNLEYSTLSIWNCILLFTNFLLKTTDSVLLFGTDYEIVLRREYLVEYIEEVDNPGDDYYESVDEFLDNYISDDTDELKEELDKKHHSYFYIKVKN